MEDWFRDRAEQEAARQAARSVAEQQRRDEEQAVLDRQEWENAWHKYAVYRLPSDVSPDVTLQLPELVAQALQSTGRRRPKSVRQALVDAAVEKVLKAWRRQQDVERIIKAAVAELPWDAKSIWEMTEWQTGTTAAAREAVSKLGETAPIEEIKAVARQAVVPIVRAFEQFQANQNLISSVYVSGATYDEQKEAREAVSRALAALPIDASQAQMKSAAEEALTPFRERVAQREDEALRLDVIRHASFPWGFPGAEKEEALAAVRRGLNKPPRGASRHQLEAARQRVLQPFLDDCAQREKKRQLVENALGEIFGFLLELERHHDLPKGPWMLSDELKDGIRKHLERHLSGDEADAEAKALLRKLVRQSVKLQPKKR